VTALQYILNLPSIKMLFLKKTPTQELKEKNCFDFEIENVNIIRPEKGENSMKIECCKFSSCNWHNPFPTHAG
jgi:hypothetical protein